MNIDDLEYWKKEQMECKHFEETTAQDWFRDICRQRRKHAESHIIRLTSANDKSNGLLAWRKYHGR